MPCITNGCEGHLLVFSYVASHLTITPYKLSKLDINTAVSVRRTSPAVQVIDYRQVELIQPQPSP